MEKMQGDSLYLKVKAYQGFLFLSKLLGWRGRARPKKMKSLREVFERKLKKFLSFTKLNENGVGNLNMYPTIGGKHPSHPKPRVEINSNGVHYCELGFGFDSSPVDDDRCLSDTLPIVGLYYASTNATTTVSSPKQRRPPHIATTLPPRSSTPTPPSSPSHEKYESLTNIRSASGTLKLRLSSTNKTNSTPQLNLPPLVESQFNSQPTQHLHQNLVRNLYLLLNQDDKGTKNTKSLTVNDVWSLSHNERVVVEWNDEDQATADSEALLNRFLGYLARDSGIFPISYTSWKKIPKDYKQNVLKDIIQEKAQKNKDNRKKQTIPHTGGSMSLARKKQKMELECGRKVSRGEIWIATHKHANGEFVNEEAKEIGEKIEIYELSGNVSKDISSQDSLAQTLGNQEHCGRVRGLGLGPCPSRLFGNTIRSSRGISSSSPSYRELQNEVFDQESAQPLKVSNHTPTNSEDKE
ncbi:hypothetical protein Fmac_018572 [Flemingia macrophylla]|uniref:Uncharacterized protein n=1 Tax=Flemingia macrophylla TaxID=520843 RepID=A0ABD1M5I2_9FABA